MKVLNHTKITFLMTAHNAETFIKESINSVMSQTLPDIKLIIRNNGSTDHTQDVIRRCQKKDKRIFCLENRENWRTDEGFGFNDRDWWPEFCSDYVAIIDHDDRLDRDFAKVLYREAERTKADITACGRVYISEATGRALGKSCPPAFTAHGGTEAGAYFPGIYNPVCRTVWGKLYRTDFFEKYYDEARKLPEGLFLSTDTWIVFNYLERCGKLTCVDQALYYYKLSSESGFRSKRPDHSRIHEGEILYQKGKEYLSLCRALTGENLKFLESVYLGHVVDLLRVLKRSQVMEKNEKLAYLEDIVQEERFQFCCESGFETIFPHIQSFVRTISSESALPLSSDIKKSDEKPLSSLYQFFILRVCEGFARREEDPMAFCLFLSGVYDEKNRGRFGWQLILKEWPHLTAPEYQLCKLSQAMTGEVFLEFLGAPGNLTEFLYEKAGRCLLEQKEDQLAEAVEQQDLERAASLLRQVTELCPESEYSCYYRAYLSELIGEHETAVRTAYAAMALHQGSKEVKALCEEILCGREKAT